MSEQLFKPGDSVILVDEKGRHVRTVDHVTVTGIVVLSGDSRVDQRFRQDGTATNNMGRARIEQLRDLQPGDLVAFQIVGRVESVSSSGYVVFAHGVAGIPILKSSVSEVFDPEEEVKRALK
jgi:hypothetical protein